MPHSQIPDSDHRVIRFPGAGGGEPPQRPQQPPIEDLRKFEQQASDGDDYRRRMADNVIAGAFLLLLIVGGLWIADTLATQRKNQDCVLSGRRGCTPVEVPINPR